MGVVCIRSAVFVMLTLRRIHYQFMMGAMWPLVEHYELVTFRGSNEGGVKIQGTLSPLNVTMRSGERKKENINRECIEQIMSSAVK